MSLFLSNMNYCQWTTGYEQQWLYCVWTTTCNIGIDRCTTIYPTYLKWIIYLNHIWRGGYGLMIMFYFLWISCGIMLLKFTGGSALHFLFPWSWLPAHAHECFLSLYFLGMRTGCYFSKAGKRTECVNPSLGTPGEHTNLASEA